MLTDTESPAHHLWFTADHRALFAGADQKRPPDRLREQDAGAAHRPVDVRAVAALSGDLRRGAGVRLGRAAGASGRRRAVCRRASQLSASAISRSARRTIRRARTWPAASSCGASRASPEKEDEHFSFARNLVKSRAERRIRRRPYGADSGIFRINPLQGWQREAILKAAQLLRERFGNPPGDAAGAAARTTACSKSSIRPAGRCGCRRK